MLPKQLALFRTLAYTLHLQRSSNCLEPLCCCVHSHPPPFPEAKLSIHPAHLYRGLLPMHPWLTQHTRKRPIWRTRTSVLHLTVTNPSSRRLLSTLAASTTTTQWFYRAVQLLLEATPAAACIRPPPTHTLIHRTPIHQTHPAEGPHAVKHCCDRYCM